ncbi:MAG: J domain-containing protein [Arthrobacter sp.]|uniref:J domain-containing protein n=1 Tax=unclassified Arthrobacter TaxID=235627 RepID=UPI002653DD0F|nr:J domain-containing protein [Micrococcaceae bacterium]MDN5879777.1 J domain-containing protein [Micrococcaceae bacterium]MDN5886999.1 J domain-containing protein [Micrococcaceae bacterium]MDN5905291.1 J domain-containing protein [Micrococcaceae bacterium]
MSPARTHYEVLGITRDASLAEVKTAYRRAARTTHPDQGGDAAAFRVVSLAYQTLRDPVSRAAYDRSYGTSSAYQAPASDARAAARSTPRTEPAGGRRPTATDSVRYVPAFSSTPTPVLTETVASRQIHGAPRKRGLFTPQSRLAREAGTVRLLSGRILPHVPAARLVNGLHSPAGRGFIDHVVLCGYRLALVNSMVLPRGVYRWDGTTLHQGGKAIDPPRMASLVRGMQEAFPELNVTGWTVVHSPDDNLHEPVIDYARGADPASASLTHVVNAANLVRELKMFLGTGPSPNVVDVPLLSRLIGGMY